MVATGYEVERGLFMSGFGLLFVIYCWQSLTEFCSMRREAVGTIKWAAHRIGPFSCLLNMIQAVDSSEVFGIWTENNRVDYFLSYNATSCILVLAASASYSMLMSHSMIIQEKPPRWLAIGYIATLTLPFIVGNATPAYAVATSSTVPRAFYLFVVAIAFLFCDISFVVSCTSLLHKLDAFSTSSGQQSPQYDTKRMASAITSLKRFRLFSIVLTNIAIVYQVYSAVQALSKPLRPDPENFDVGGMGFMFLQWLAMFLILWFTWNRKGGAHTTRSNLSGGGAKSSSKNQSPRHGSKGNSKGNKSGGDMDHRLSNNPADVNEMNALEKSMINSMSDGRPVVIRLAPGGTSSSASTSSPSPEQSYRRMDDAQANGAESLKLNVHDSANDNSLVEQEPVVEETTPRHIIIETSVTRS